jgi:FecR protein
VNVSRGGALAVALWCAASLPAQSGPVVARAAGVEGSAIITTPGAAALLLTPGYVLTPGDRIDTRGGGRVVIDLSDGSLVVVAPESVVVLKDYRTAGSLRELFEITLGAVRVKINHFAGKPNPYRMNSPTASIAVRGTEFTITVALRGETQVDVIEGLVEVSPLNNPAAGVLVGAGRSALVQLGQDIRLIGANQPPPGNRGDDRGPPGHDPRQAQQAVPNAPPPVNPAAGKPDPKAPEQIPAQAPAQKPMALPGNLANMDPHDGDGHSPRASASTYERYLAGLADISQAPFLLRFNAFSDAHLDSLENPAYATQFHASEGRLLFLPTFRGTRALQEYGSAFGPGGSLTGGYSISPQISFFAPAGGFTFGGAASASRVSDSGASSNFYSGALIGSRQFGANSFGLELASLHGSDGGDTSSDVSQTRATIGFARNLTASSTLGVYYRYGSIRAADQAAAGFGPTAQAWQNGVRTTGHSSEAGIRLRGMLTPRVYYGITAAWQGISLRDALASANALPSHARDRAQRGSVGAGLGFALTNRTMLTLDLAGGSGRTSASRTEDDTFALLQNAADSSRFVTLHTAVQRDVTRRFFVSASLLQIWQSHRLNVDLFPDRYGRRTFVQDSFFPMVANVPYAPRFSDFGAGWRFTRNFYGQYVFSTDYGVTNATHSLLFRWTWRGKGD